MATIVRPVPIIATTNRQQPEQIQEKVQTVFLDLIGSDELKQKQEKESHSCENMETDMCIDISQQ